jgi:hypothetical protein
MLFSGRSDEVEALRAMVRGPLDDPKGHLTGSHVPSLAVRSIPLQSECNGAAALWTMAYRVPVACGNGADYASLCFIIAASINSDCLRAFQP